MQLCAVCVCVDYLVHKSYPRKSDMVNSKRLFLVFCAYLQNILSGVWISQTQNSTRCVCSMFALNPDCCHHFLDDAHSSMCPAHKGVVHQTLQCRVAKVQHWPVLHVLNRP